MEGRVAAGARPEERAVTVTVLTTAIKEILEGEPAFRDLWVRGEVSNWKRHTSGHCYFTLKDAGATVRCVMFRGRASTLAFRPSDGMAVLVRGEIGVFPRDGAYQLYAHAMDPAGLGSLHQAFEELKARLRLEGLFAEEAKRPLPLLPRRVALVTSATGAALRDMLQIATRRNPAVQLALVPALVQGPDAPASLVEALGKAGGIVGADVVIIGRGGGSLEELWAFNDETVARAIRACPVPVVSAVGHETDFTIADFAADRRAPTPSAAVELVVPDRQVLLGQVEAVGKRADRAMRALLDRERGRLARALRGPLARPEGALEAQRNRLMRAMARLHAWGRVASERRRGQVGTLAGRLDAMSPLAVLARGYAVCRDDSGTIVRAPSQAPVGSDVDVIVRDGRLRARVLAHGPAVGHSVAARQGLKVAPAN